MRLKNPHKLILQGGKAMVTIKQVAEEAGVSRSTVSRYIS
ncbi:TPA: LacI family DNA-binding transcriptional regulator [Streptococcus pyogenes]|nr:LacI family DNA-binding transcriptional regulator [Streptococcus pyogenes]